MRQTDQSHVDGLDLDAARGRPSPKRGRAVGPIARFALFVANATLALLCLILDFFLFMGAVMAGGTKGMDRLGPWLGWVGLVLFLAACAALVVTWRLARHARWATRWQAAVGAALLVVLVMAFTAPPGFWAPVP
jgi:glucan phosphoethanolaminetransferase (alkaline phosphatase superfamily)